MNSTVRSIISGLAGALIMFLLMMLAIKGLEIAPFKMPPSAAFLKSLGITPKPLALIIHFGYGAVAAYFLHAAFRDGSKIKYGLGLAVAMWFVMMLVVSPIIGWGIFGSNAGNLDRALALSSMPKYIVSTLILHLIYGLSIGLIQQYWIGNKTNYDLANS